MNFKEFLEFNIIDTSKYDLSIYNILALIIIIIGAKVLLGVVKRIFKRLEKQKSIELGTSHAIYQIIKYLVWILAILLILDSLGVKITILLASSAALMVGLGLGLQQIFQDFVSGVTLLIEGSLKVNDIVETHKGEVGRVKQIGLRTSKVETRDNIILIVPNSKLINESLINWSHIAKTTRFDINIGVAYGSNVGLVKRLLLKCASAHPEIEQVPKPDVFFSEFGDSSLNFRLLFYTKNTFRVEKIKSDLRFSIENTFRENKVTIPFPQRDVHLYNK
ncbi:MAG TPA: mechanosensitive ion channel protein MscS [Bacteroidales bacterium]|jgi:small-conductance mechanosensitive channel|nr:mechanosensitive ion channel protein MscS [Bacteroidales bacterium]